MHAARPRARASLSEWPQLSLLAVYSDEPLLDPTDGFRDARLDDAALEAARVLYFNAPLESEEMDAARRNRIMGTITGVQGFARTLAPAGSQDLRAVHSSKRRMVWLQVEPGFYVHATVQLPKQVRRSRSASTATAESSSSGTAALHPVEDEYLIAALRQSSRRFRLRHGTLVQLLQREGKGEFLGKLAAHWDRWLRQVDILNSRSLEDVVEAVPHSSLLTPSTTSQLRPLLAQFAASNPSALPILLHGKDVLALPKLPETDRPVVDEPGRPPPPPLREDELVDVVRYLADLVPQSTVLAVHDDSSNSQVTRSTTSSAVSNAWSSSLSTLANGMSFLSPRPLSLSLAAVSTATEPRQRNQPPSASSKSLRAGFAAMRQQEKAALSAPERGLTPESSGVVSGQGQASSRSRNEESKDSNVDSAWSFPSVSWSKLGFGSGAATTAAAAVKSAADVAVNREEASAPLNTSSEAIEGASFAETPDQSVVLDDGGTLETPSREAETPQVELAPTVDTEELAAAIGVTPEQEDRQFQLVQVRNESTLTGDETATATGASSPTAAEDDEPIEYDQRVLEIYVGGAELSKCQLRRYTRGLLSLGLAVLPSTDEAAISWLDSRAERLLEAVETMTELVQPPKAAYPHRHLIKDGAMVTSVTSSRDEAASSATGTDSAYGSGGVAADDDEAESAAALLESYRSLHSSPPILESITRLSSARWALHRQHTPPSLSVPRRTREVYAIVPSRNARGREISLVDAADELRRIERAYEKW